MPAKMTQTIAGMALDVHREFLPFSGNWLFINISAPIC